MANRTQRETNWTLLRQNEALQAQLAKEREMVQFLGLLTADIDIEDLMDDASEEVSNNG